MGQLLYVMVAVAPKAPTQPDWDSLFVVAQAQSGYCTTAQVAQSGYSRPLLHKYLATGKVVRVRRGV